MKDLTVYNVSVEMTLRQNEKGQQFLVSAKVSDKFPEWLNKLANAENNEITSMVIDARVEALIAGLANCMYLSESIGHKNTYESLEVYIEKLKEYFKTPLLFVEKETEKNGNNIQGE